jgi:hypothetical protein
MLKNRKRQQLLADKRMALLAEAIVREQRGGTFVVRVNHQDYRGKNLAGALDAALAALGANPSEDASLAERTVMQ